jgi:hypothetical protein
MIKLNDSGPTHQTQQDPGLGSGPLPVLQTFGARAVLPAGGLPKRTGDCPWAGRSELLNRGFLVSTHRLPILSLTSRSFFGPAKYFQSRKIIARSQAVGDDTRIKNPRVVWLYLLQYSVRSCYPAA